MPCLLDEELASLRDGRLPASLRASVEAHLASCASCRDLARGVTSESPSLAAWWRSPLRARLEALAVPPRRLAGPRWSWAVAAVLLMAVALGAWRLQGKGKVPPPSPAPAGEARVCQAVDADTSFPVGQAGLLTLKAGSAASLEGSTTIRLTRGTAYLEGLEEPLELAVGEARLFLVDGTVVAELEAGAPVRAGLSWPATAWAGTEPDWRIVVTWGEARIQVDARTHLLRAGQQLRRDSEVEPLGPLAWKGEAGCHEVPGLPVTFGEGMRVLGEVPAEGYVWEAVICRAAATGVSLCCPVGTRGVDLPLGEAPVPVGERHVRVRATYRQERLQVEVAGKTVFSGSAEEAVRRFPSARPECGLRCRGGALEVSLARWWPCASILPSGR